MCKVQDDSDMKIVGEYVNPEPKTIITPEMVVEQDQNGNLDKAKALAISLIEASKEYEKKHPIHNNSLRFQRWIVLLFVADMEIARRLPNSLVADMATAHFHSLLQTEAVEMYRTLEENGSYSFYNCCQEKKIIDEKAASEVFASLCGHPNSVIFQDLGHILIDECQRGVLKLAEQQHFTF